jgi:hypothetical protein
VGATPVGAEVVGTSEVGVGEICGLQARAAITMKTIERVNRPFILISFPTFLLKVAHLQQREYRVRRPLPSVEVTG